MFINFSRPLRCNVSQSLFQRNLNHSSFIYCLTDIRQINIFVNADWNITCLVDP